MRPSSALISDRRFQRHPVRAMDSSGIAGITAEPDRDERRIRSRRLYGYQSARALIVVLFRPWIRPSLTRSPVSISASSSRRYTPVAALLKDPPIERARLAWSRNGGVLEITARDHEEAARRTEIESLCELHFLADDGDIVERGDRPGPEGESVLGDHGDVASAELQRIGW